MTCRKNCSQMSASHTIQLEIPRRMLQMQAVLREILRVVHREMLQTLSPEALRECPLRKIPIPVKPGTAVRRMLQGIFLPEIIRLISSSYWTDRIRCSIAIRMPCISVRPGCLSTCSPRRTPGWLSWASDRITVKRHTAAYSLNRRRATGTAR